MNCLCPTNAAGDIRCHVCGEYVNKKCWRCGTQRGEGLCPNRKRDHAVEAVQEALTEPVEDDPIMSEMESLWGDLEEAKRHARNGVWSMGCDYAIYRIVRLTRHAGRPVPADAVPFTLLLDGTYTHVHEAMGIEPEPFDAEETRRKWENYLGRNLP